MAASTTETTSDVATPPPPMGAPVYQYFHDCDARAVADLLLILLAQALRYSLAGDHRRSRSLVAASAQTFRCREWGAERTCSAPREPHRFGSGAGPALIRP